MTAHVIFLSEREGGVIGADGLRFQSFLERLLWLSFADFCKYFFAMKLNYDYDQKETRINLQIYKIYRQKA